MNLEELRTRLGTPPPPTMLGITADGVPIERCVSGQFVRTREHEIFIADTVRGESQSHGRHSFGLLSRTHPERLATMTGTIQRRSSSTPPATLWDDSFLPVDVSRTAFIDTETTGLGYGVGTHVFLIGVGHLEGDVFRVRQFFLRHPGEEPAMLHALADYLRSFEAIVSYNGRSFDWPLIENRFVFRRVPFRTAGLTHLDLLHMSRRLWKQRLEDCSLGSVERSVLGVSRSRDDVEGWMIPQLYFQYLRSGDARPLARVFYHNLHDIWSLAMLMTHVEMVLRDPWGGLVEDPTDFFSLGKLFYQSREDELAVRCFRHALESGLPGHMQPMALLRLAMIHKRRREWESATPLFESLIGARGFERIACVELAKYREHVARDHGAAMSLTKRALQTMEFPAIGSWPGIRTIELLHRKSRLTTRIAAMPATVT